MRRLRQCYRAALVALLFVVGLAAVAVLFPLLDWLPVAKARRARGWIQVGWYAGLSVVLGVQVRRSGEPCGRGALWVSNHISWLDIVVLGARRPLTFIAKAEIGDWPVVGFLARRSGTVLVRRGDAGSSRLAAERMAQLLDAGEGVVLFPEGTSTDGASVRHFHARLFAPASRVRVPAQPIGLAYRGAAASLVPFIGDDAFLPHLWRVLGEPRLDVDVFFCQTLDAAEHARNRLAEEARAAVMRALAGEIPIKRRSLARRGYG